MKKADTVYLDEIKQAVERILEYTANEKEVFMTNIQVQDAVLRNFQVLGEAARRVSETFKESHPDIPWADMIGMRNVVIHDYAALDFHTLWETIVKDLPNVLQKIKTL